MADELDDLIKEAKALGIKVDRRMSEETIRAKIEAEGEGVDTNPQHEPVNPFAPVSGMIEKMAKATSLDLNKHQIQASILGRLEGWAKKQGLEDEWMAQLPKYTAQIREVAEQRHEKVKRFLERNQLEKQRLLARTELEVS